MPDLPKPTDNAVSTRMAKTDTINAPNRYITTAEVADLLAISVPTVHVYIRKGIIPARRFGDVVRILRDEFDVWFESIRTTTPKP